ncbi:universal stress protein [Sphaerisporangium fuscum]|uniref:universal stress protein n=1 Tax=Sphaerisporangium fuscum TaxID=2835868 RepID=UPI001BDC6EDB|nr:universal stress protein [Sphaerisporangium fuscum]
MNGRVVAGTDGSPRALTAVRWAADDAARRDRGLRIVHVIEPWTFDQPLATPPGFHDSLCDHARSLLDEAAATARERVPNLDVETETLIGSIRKELLKETDGADELVMGSRGLGGFMGLVLGSVSMGVAGHARCPVVVVAHEQDAVHGEIAVGHDGSPGSEAALRYAFEEANLRGARLTAVYAWQVSVFLPMFASYTPDLERLYDFGRRGAQEQLRPWRDKYPQVEVREITVRAHPVEALSEASARADLLVVGSRGRGAVGSAVLGSVSHGALHHSCCPVAVVRSAEPEPEPEPERGRGVGT